MTRWRTMSCWISLTGCSTPRASTKRGRALKRAADLGRERSLTREALSLFRSDDEFVADAMDSDDVARVARSLLDLLAQFGDVHVNRTGEGEAAVAPDRIEQLVAGDH